MPEAKLVSRLDWNDEDWAKQLNCPVSKVPEYRKIMEDNFLTCIERDKVSGLYSFAMYRYDTAPSGAKRLQLMLTCNKNFSKAEDALHDANNIISTWELSDFWAKIYGVPKQAVQMLLINEKGK